MVVPDFELICEIMLVAEGFQEARILARKFITLYTLCKELLSKQDHYDWGLRAIKSVLVVAGSLKVLGFDPRQTHCVFLFYYVFFDVMD
jgi:dynein heavy chain